MNTNSSDILTVIRNNIVNEIAAWRAHLAARASDGHTVLSGTPFVVACDGGLALHVKGNVARPVNMTPGLCGISHYDRAGATRIAALRGAPYRVVAAAEVPAMRIAELETMLSELPTK